MSKPLSGVELRLAVACVPNVELVRIAQVSHLSVWQSGRTLCGLILFGRNYHVISNWQDIMTCGGRLCHNCTAIALSEIEKADDE